MLEEMLSDPESVFQPEAYLYQDFSVRCRMQKLQKVPLDLAAFRRRFAPAQCGVFDPTDPRWREMLAVADRLPASIFAPFPHTPSAPHARTARRPETHRRTWSTEGREPG